MDQRTQYLLQILETIGSPLIQAIVDAAPDKDGDLKIEAQAIAALLGKTVEASISLGDIMEINPAEAQDDTLRVALAGLAGPLIAGQYKKRGTVPESPDIKKVTGALQAVLTFSDNFSPTPETVERLKNLEAGGQMVDGYQSQIQYIQAFVPVVEAVAAFPFGQPEAKLVMDVSDRLVKKAVQLREALLPDQNDEALQKRAELALLKSLAALYASCHHEETRKATSQNNETPANIESVWSAFDMRAAMMESLAGNIVPEGGQKRATSSGGGISPDANPSAPPVAPVAETPPPPATETPPSAPPQAAPEAPPPQEPPQTPPAAAQPPAQPPADTPAAGANPMAMFAKPKADGAGSDGAATPPPVAPPSETPTPPPPPATEAPPAAPPPAAPEAPPPQEPPQTPPPAQPEQPPAEQPPQNPPASGNPMSFFTKKDDEE